jgi:hypothetical protein
VNVWEGEGNTISLGTEGVHRGGRLQLSWAAGKRCVIMRNILVEFKQLCSHIYNINR